MLNRRKFLVNSSLAAGATLAASSGIFGQGKEEPAVLPLIKPKRLSKGDTIGLVTPASALSRTAFEKTLENLETLGLKVKYSDNIRVSSGFLAGTNEQRVRDLHEMFEDDGVDGIVCARGGYGTMRILELLDYSLIQANPKVLVGYSDITALLYGIHKNTGLVCFHGPVGASDFTEFTTKQFTQTLLKGRDKLIIRQPQEWTKEQKEDELVEPRETDQSVYELIRITDGVSKGGLVGGNLSLMVSLIGTPYDIDFTDKIVFIEEIGESLYRVDRMITQLLMSGKLANAKGLALGVFKGCDLKPGDPGYEQSLSLKTVLKERLGSLNIPTIYGLPIGHIKDNATLPFGIEAELDVTKGRLTSLDSGVS